MSESANAKAKVICFANQKGGPGKTTTCHNVSVQFARTKKRVLCIDMDGQGNLSKLLDIETDETPNNIASFLTDQKGGIKSVIHKTKLENLDLIPSNRNTYFAEKDLVMKNGREFILTDGLEEIKGEYDIISIDTPPNLGLLTFSSILASNFVLLVTTSSELSLDGLSEVLDTIESIQTNKRLNVNNTKVMGAIRNDYKMSNKIINRYAENELQSAKALIPRVFSSIRSTTEIEKAQKDHKPIYDFIKNHPVIDDYKKLTREILKCLS
jgi:chromosome partitioning protein